MIKKFDQYNESIRDQMVGKSDEEVDIAVEKVLKQLEYYKDNLDDKEAVNTYINLILKMYDLGDFIKLLIDKGAVDGVELLYVIFGELFNAKYFERNAESVARKIYKYIEKNKEQIKDIDHDY